MSGSTLALALISPNDYYVTEKYHAHDWLVRVRCAYYYSWATIDSNRLFHYRFIALFAPIESQTVCIYRAQFDRLRSSSNWFHFSINVFRALIWFSATRRSKHRTRNGEKLFGFHWLSQLDLPFSVRPETFASHLLIPDRVKRNAWWSCMNRAQNGQCRMNEPRVRTKGQ